MDLAKLHLHWRASRHKGMVYRSYSLARAYRLDGKNRKEIIVKLGKLSDEAADRWRALLKAIKKTGSFATTLKDITVASHFSFLDVAAANATWDRWRLDEVFRAKGNKNIGTGVIARILAVNRCIDPMSKSQTPQWFSKTALPWMLGIGGYSINVSRIFRELEAIENRKEDICRHLFKLMSDRDPKSMKSVFYDLSSTTFYGSKCVLMKWGHCKEGYRNHVVLAVVVNGDGLPFYWEVLPGGTADAKTITWLMDRLKKRFKVSGTTLVFDRGMVSDENLALLEKEKVKYISAMDKNQIEKLTGLNFDTSRNLKRLREEDTKVSSKFKSTKPFFLKFDKNTSYREIKVKDKRRYILCFNRQLFNDQCKARRQAVVDFRFFCEQLNEELLHAKKTRQKETTLKKFKKGLLRYKLSGFVNVVLSSVNIQVENNDGTSRKIRTYQGTPQVNDKDLITAGKLDGFWLLVTNHIQKKIGGTAGSSFIVSAKQAINPYREKVVIESSFRDIKSFVEVAPVYVWSEKHVKAHYTICVLSHLINRTLTINLHKNRGDSSTDIVTHEKLYVELSDCMIDHIEIESAKLSAYNMTKPSTKQKDLLDRINMRELLSFDALKIDEVVKV